MGNICPECGKGELVLREVKANVSAAGLFGALLAVIGVVTAFMNAVAGVLMIILGILIGYLGRSRKIEAICPMCSYKKAI